MFAILAYRTFVMFVVIIVTIRILGKRQLGQLELSELVLAIMISEVAVSPITNLDHRLLHGLIPIAVLLVSQLIIAILCMKSVRIRSFIIGKPSIIVQNGQVSQSEMKKNRLTLTELAEQLRAQGITDISTIKYAILESNGSISIMPYTAHAPATHTAHQLPVEDNGLPIFVIMDGRLLEENLKILGLDQRWLTKELQRRGVPNHKDVYMLTVDENRNIYFAAKN